MPSGSSSSRPGDRPPSSSRTCRASASSSSSTSSSTRRRRAIRRCRSIRRRATPTACPSGSACQRDNYTMYPLQNRFFVNALYGAGSAAAARRLRAAPDHRRLRRRHHPAKLDDAVPPDARPQRVRQLPAAALRHHAQPGDGQLPRHRRQHRSTCPNENYAREILQLFSIGTVRLNPDGTQQLDGRGQPIPTYTQTTVNNFARVFTGWRLAAAPAPGVPNYIDPMVANEAQHDVGAEDAAERRRCCRPDQTTAQDLTTRSTTSSTTRTSARSSRSS